MYKSDTEKAVIRLDTTTSVIRSTVIENIADYRDLGISFLIISNNEILFTYITSSPEKYNIVKASYDESSNLLSEEYHQSLQGNSYHY